MQTTNIIPEDEEEFNYQNISQKENKESEIISQINTCQSNNIMNTSINIQNKNELKINENNKNYSQIISYKENQSFQSSENNDNYSEYNLKNIKKLSVNNKNSIEKEREIIDLLRKLIYNAKKGDKENLLNILEKLIDEEINLNYRDEMGFSVLHYAVDEGNFKICEILIKTNLIDVNLKSLNEGKTPLHISCQNGYFDISKLLLLNNAEINISDNERNTPLHYSIQGNYFEVSKLLINYLKDYSIFKKKNIYGQNIMNLAYKSRNEKIRNLFENYIDKKLISEENLNKTEMNLLNLALSPNSNKRNRLIRSKGVLYSNSNNLCSSHKKLVSYMNKYSSYDHNKEIDYQNNINNNNNAKKKIYHLHSISSMNDEISTFNPLTSKNMKNIKENKDLNNKNNNSHVTTNSDLFNISQSSYKANSNFKSSTTANTLGTINSNISNNSIGSCNKIKNEDKKELKKNLTGTDKKKNYHKIIHISNTNSNVASSSKSKNKKQIRGESKKKRDESKRLFIELSDSDINDKKNPKIESVTIDLNEIKKEIEENKLKNKSKSRNFKLSDNSKDKKK